MEKNYFYFEKTRVFLVKVVNHSIYIHVMRICKMLISYIRLDHTLYSINYRYHVYANRTQAKKIIMILNFARFSGKGHHALH